MREREITLVKKKHTKILGSILNNRNAALFSIKFAINKYVLIMQCIKKYRGLLFNSSHCARGYKTGSSNLVFDAKRSLPKKLALNLKTQEK